MNNINLPTIENYGQYSNDNYGAHCLKMTDGNGNKYWFSYSTMIAFEIKGEFHIIKNYWGTTTGKHLNFIDTDKRIRETEEEFENNYKRLCA